MKAIQQQANLHQIGQSLNNLSIDNLNPDQLKEVVKMLYVEKAKTVVKAAIDKASFDLASNVASWLDSYQSNNTKIAYKKALVILKEYLTIKELHILEMKAVEIDAFICWLNNQDLSSPKKRQVIAACSSLFSRLVRWEFLDHNYFKNATLPKKQKVKAYKIPTIEEVEKIRATIEGYKNASGKGSTNLKKSYKKSLAIFDLFVSAGCRLGSVKTITVGKNGRITGRSKGKDFTDVIEIDLAKRLKMINLKKCKDSTLKKMIKTACKKAGTRVFSAHDFRHFFALEYYKNSQHDIYGLQQRLHHSSISITEIYLREKGVL